jgi:hypothetical protein
LGVYKTAELMINEMALDLVKNKDLMKYLVYNDTTIDPLTKPDVTSPSQYVFNPKNYIPGDSNSLDKFRIYQTRIPDITQNVKSIISVNLLRTEAIDNNPYFKKYILAFDILTHVDINVISGSKIRLLEIMDLIHEQYSEKYTSNSIQKLFPLDDIPITYNEKFFGWRLPYHATTISSQNAINR